MAKLDFEVDHVAASRTGDEGVDVFAEDSKTAGAWAIQCKCYALERKVGPAVVRELIGDLATYPATCRAQTVRLGTHTGPITCTGRTSA